MLTVDGIPAHPLVVHAVVVLLPLAAVGTLLVAARPLWRRQLGVWVLLLALAGTAAVPVAQQTGEQLAESLGGGAPARHGARDARSTLLLPALVFLALLAATVLVGRRGGRPERRRRPARPTRWPPAPCTLQRVTVVSGLLAALAGLVVTGLVVWTGHAGCGGRLAGVDARTG